MASRRGRIPRPWAGCARTPAAVARPLTGRYSCLACLTHPEARSAAADALHLALAERYFELAARWIRAQPDEPAEWREAAEFGDSLLYLTPAELRELSDQIGHLVQAYAGRLDDPGTRPAGARPVVVLRLAFPALISGQR